MPKKRISRIELEKFRGATTTTEIEFDESKPIVVIFGENGSGKSTIGNALDFVCNRSKGSLESLSSTRFAHLVAIGHDPKELKVRLYQGAEVWIGSQDGSKITIDPSTDVPTVFTLRRSQLMRLIEATPAKRFDEIRRFIDFDKIEISEQRLRDAERKSRADLDRKIELHTQAVTSLEGLWKNDGAPGSDARAWAAGKLSVDLSASRAELQEIDSASSAINSFLKSKLALDQALIEVASAKRELADIEARVAEEESRDADSGIGMADLLSQLKKVIAEPYGKDQCPACLSDYDLRKLRAEVEKRLVELTSSQQLSQQRRFKTSALKTKSELLDRARTAVQKTIVAVKESGAIRLESAARDDGDASRGLSNVDFESAVFTDEQLSILDTLLQHLKNELVAKRPVLSKDIDLYDAIKSAADLVDRTELETTAEDAISKALKGALDIVHGKRNRKTQEILDAVFDDCLSLWEAIHPGEPIKPTKFKLSETAKGSLEQVGKFGDHEDIPPQAYFSESHLDTLGFCYWLAIAKYATAGKAIIVLDDVFTSVDIEHISRILDLLVDESEKFDQIILTTHQRRWHDEFRYGARSQAKTHVLELGIWDLKNGIATYPTRMEVEKLEEVITRGPLDRQAVCGKAGVILEQMYDELTKQYRCSLPRGPREAWTLADYSSSTRKLFGKLKIRRPDNAGGVKEIDLAGFHDELSPFVTVRNQVGAHFNLTAAEFSDKDIVRFGNTAVELISTLLCRGCKRLANRIDKASGTWKCDCKATEMLPNSL